MTETTTATARRGPTLPLVACVLGVATVPLAFMIAIAAWPLMIASLVCAIIGIRRRDRLWGLGVVAIVAVIIAVLGMFVAPALLTLLAWAAGARFDDPGQAWDMFWGLAWYSWLGPLAP